MEQAFRPAAATPLLSVILSDAEGANATEAESKDPENAASAMLIEGVLTMNHPQPFRSRTLVNFPPSPQVREAEESAPLLLRAAYHFGCGPCVSINRAP